MSKSNLVIVGLILIISVLGCKSIKSLMPGKSSSTAPLVDLERMGSERMGSRKNGVRPAICAILVDFFLRLIIQYRHYGEKGAN